MSRRLLAMLAAGAIAGTVAIWAPWSATAAPSAKVHYEPHLDPKDFSLVIDNPYYPLPGRPDLGLQGGQGRTDADRHGEGHVTNGARGGGHPHSGGE